LAHRTSPAQPERIDEGQGLGRVAAVLLEERREPREVLRAEAREHEDRGRPRRVQRVEEAGLSDRVSVLFSDYRDIKGKFDKLVSIEMIEAVGHQYLNTFFKVCSDRLKDDGMMMLQAITITDRVFDRHKRSVDFIKRYIFPGSCIPSITAMSDALARFTDLKMDHLEDITPHYARTLRTWRSRFFDNLESIKTLGFSDRFIRMWEYYLCYCEAGFTERYLGDVQIRLIKPLCRPKPILPPLGDEEIT